MLLRKTLDDHPAVLLSPARQVSVCGDRAIRPSSLSMRSPPKLDSAIAILRVATTVVRK